MTEPTSVPEVKKRLLHMIKDNLQWERLDRRAKLMEEVAAGNEWATIISTLLVDRGELLQILNQALVLLGLSWEEMAQLEKEEDGEFLIPDSEVSDAVFWFLSKVDMLESSTNRARQAGFDDWDINDVGDEIDPID